MRIVEFSLLRAVVICLAGLAASAQAQAQDQAQSQETANNTSALRPVYPPNFDCGAITSPFGALRDLDGSLRAAPHVGIDLGDFGDVVIAPADGTIGAIWQVQHPWGMDWNLLVIHTAADLNLTEDAVLYYTEFDHLQRADMAQIMQGQRISRGDPIGIVRHPGNNARFRAEVHMEVHRLPIAEQDNTQWLEDGFKYWWNPAAELVDPLEMMSLYMAQASKGSVDIVAYAAEAVPADFRGFTYPLRCRQK